MVDFRIVTMDMKIPVPPDLLNDVGKAIDKYLDRLLLRYSRSIRGIPLCYDAICSSKTGTIQYDSPDVIIVARIKMLVLPIAKGDVIECKRGMYVGIIRCVIGGSCQYSGNAVVSRISKGMDGLAEICGEKTALDHMHLIAQSSK